MADYLLFRLYGPMAAWGDTAVGGTRPSYSHPSHSAVIGLLAAALGLKREQEQALLELDRGYLLGVRNELPGELLRDYHTAQVPPAQRGMRYRTRRDELRADRLHTILSQRDYRVDACYSLALKATGLAPATLLELAAALQAPAFPLYLGRKSCPLALPTDPRILTTDTLMGAFAQYPPAPQSLREMLGDQPYLPWATERALDFAHTRYYWDEAMGDSAGLAAEMIYPRRDRLHSRGRWQFQPRNECYATLANQEET